MPGRSADLKTIAVIGSGISGLSAAWLLDKRHQVTVFEGDGRIGGHSNTIEVAEGGRTVPVDTGFIVYNRNTYPNLTALFDHLGVATQASEMSFAVSLDGGRLEYSGKGLASLFAQKRNFFRPRFWSMLRDILRFYREAPADLAALDDLESTLGHYLDARGYSDAFSNDHILPMAAAIWSAPPCALRDFPAAAFVRFQHNHGLLQLSGRPIWRTVTGGSRTYVDKLTHGFRDRIVSGNAVVGIRRDGRGVTLRLADGNEARFDDVVIATHADQALALLEAPTPAEQRLLGAFRYSRSEAVLHCDPSFMPKRRAAWASWNYIGNSDSSHDDNITVTYWMNRLQGLDTARPLFVTLNPERAPDPSTVFHRETYDHPTFDPGAMAAQRHLWSLQGTLGTWYCGAYFGAGFHEDGLQSGLAAAEALGGVRRPWTVPDESGRIWLGGEIVQKAPEDLAA